MDRQEGTSEVQRMIVGGYLMGGYKPVMPPLEDLLLHRERNPPEESAPGEAGEKSWRCRICGHVHYGAEPPEECPYCFFPGKAFKQAGADLEQPAG